MFSFEEEFKKEKLITIHFILNGYPQKLFSHTFAKIVTRPEAEELCQFHWPNSKRAFRFFSLEGVELIEQQLEYARNGQRIYVSRGEQFDSERNFGEYTLLKPLGEGGFGKVWLARSSISQEQAAIKLIKLQKITGARDIDMVFREVQNLKALSHPNIVKILNCYTLSNMQLVVVMQYLSGGQLLSLLKVKERFSEPEAKKVFEQIIAAVSYCHRQNIIHRDLKLENILVADKVTLRVKVADFGISGVADSFNPQIDIGTLRYMAPQVLSKKEKINTASVDVWACGIMLFCLIYGHLPFTGTSNTQIAQNIINGEFSFPNRPIISANCRNLITICLQTDPKKRPSAGDLEVHPWMSFQIIQPQTQEALPEIIRNPQNFKKGEEIKKTVIIPKRLQREKKQLLDDLKNLGSRRKMHQSQARPKKGGSQEILETRYKIGPRLRQEDAPPRQYKRVSLVHGLWK